MKKVLIIYILTFIFHVFTYSQSYTFRSISGTEGLSDLVVGALYKDSRGYVWIGTATSVERFDGVHLKHYPINASSERSKWVNTFIETSDNQIWVGTDGGFWQVGQDQVKRIAPDVIKNGVRSIVKDNEETLYIGSEAGLHIYKNGKIETILLDENAFSSANFIIGLYLDKNKRLWSITKNGLYSINLKDRKITHYPNNLVDKETNFSYRNITCIDSTLYMGTLEHGILSFDISTFKFHRYIDVGCNAIRALSCDGKDLLYVGTDGNGAHFISTKQKKIIRSFRYESEKEGGLRSNSVYSLLVDHDGLIWIGLCQFGLDYTVYQNEIFSIYSTPYFTSKDIPVRTIYIGKDEKLIGSRNGLFYIDERNGHAIKFQTPTTLRSNSIACSYTLENRVYIGTFAGGMYVFDLITKKLDNFELEQEIPFKNGHIFCLTADKDKNLWIGTSSGVYCYKDGKILKHFTSENSQLPDGNIYVIYFDSTHKGWICTENGICIWDPLSNAIKTNIFPEGFVNKEKICGIYEDSDHNLYFLPYKGSIFISDLSLNNFHRMSPKSPIEGKDAMFMIEDKKGWLWIGTNNGLYHFDKKETFKPFSFADGIPSPIFLACEPVIDQSGVLWFGNSKGLLRLSADWEDKANELAYKIEFSDVLTNTTGEQTSIPIIKSEDGECQASLNSSQNNVTICFSSFTYTNPAYMSYEYKMEGVDEDWKVLTGKSEVTYYNLPSGKCTFKVRRIGNPDTEVSLQINVPFAVNWNVWGVVLVAILLLLSIAFYIWRKRAVVTPSQEIERNKILNKEAETDTSAKEKYATSNLSIEECKRLTEKLKKVMLEEKPYINPTLKIADLASIIGVSSHTLSYLFNQYLKRNYYDYINDLRIEEFRSLVNKNEHTKYTLNALMELCGFSSRTSFFRYFKKATGVTPNEYIKNMGEPSK